MPCSLTVPSARHERPAPHGTRSVVYSIRLESHGRHAGQVIQPASSRSDTILHASLIRRCHPRVVCCLHITHVRRPALGSVLEWSHHNLPWRYSVHQRHFAWLAENRYCPTCVPDEQPQWFDSWRSVLQWWVMDSDLRKGDCIRERVNKFSESCDIFRASIGESCFRE